MTLNATEIRHRDLLLQRAVDERKVVFGSKLYHTIRDTFDIRPQVAEAMVEQLTPNPVAAASSGSATPPPAGDGYEPGWLTGRERERISNAQAGYEPVSHTFE